VRVPTLLFFAIAAALSGLLPGSAAGLAVYGQPRPLAGDGGCLRDPLTSPDELCTGTAAGLAGAQAVAVTPDGRSVYVAGADDVVALARDPGTGTLRPAVPESSPSCAPRGASSACITDGGELGGADALAVSPDGRFVYVGAADTAAVTAFARGPDGALTPLRQDAGGGYSGCVSGEPLPSSREPHCPTRFEALAGVDALAISPDGHDLYVVSYGLRQGEDSVVTLQRSPRGGGLRALPGTHGCVQSLPGDGCRAIAGLEGATAITVSPDGRYVYVASAVSGAVRGFRRNIRTGALTALYGYGGCISSGKRADGDRPCAMIVPQLAGARSLVLSPDGRELYVAAYDPGAIVVIRRDPVSGMLAPNPPNCLQAATDRSCPTPLPLLHGASALALTPDGRVLYVASQSGNSLLELMRASSDGALTPVSETATASAQLSGPIALALSPGGQSIYMASPFDEGIVALAG
jgi:DNA-binding beta-propeller fold protein YncE